MYFDKEKITTCIKESVYKKLCMSDIREKIIHRLAQAEFVSGEQLGIEFGVSRAAIAKHIVAISEMGLDIYRVTGKGYQLSSPLTLLNVASINEYLATKNASSNKGIINKVEVFGVLGSTNDYLMQQISNPHAEKLKNGQVCLAEYQSSGRGRRGRQWISPYGSNIYLSQYYFLEQGMSQAMGLSVVAALSVFNAIKSLYNYDVELKWPNDIYLEGKKLAGILIDLEGQPLESCHCVIGIGLNIAMPSISADLVDQPWSDLTKINGHNVDRSTLSAEIIFQLNQHLIEYKATGLHTMLALWHKHDIYYNKAIKIITGDKETLGISRGIDHQGALLIEIDNQVSPIYGGEVSLRGVS